jgi:PAS domain S-box-containing protein
MQEGLVVFNSEDLIQVMNDAALRIFGAEEEKILGRHIKELFAVQQEAYNLLILLEKEKHLNHYEVSFTRANGDPMICSLSASTIQDTVDGDLLKVLVVQDITERKLAEQRLREYSSRLEKNNKELDQFAYIVSHDLKAPLRAIINLAQWLHEDLEDTLSDDNKKNLEMLRGRAFRMEALISGVLEYSKIGRTKIEYEQFELSALLNEILDLLLPPRHITIRIAPGMPVLYAPKIMLLQVFSNLISNAIKYNNKPEGLIHIGVEDKKDYYQFFVEDNGPGIEPEYQEKVFVIFQTLQSRDKVESTGIGLTIVKRIVEEQGGKIWIESEVGKGTRFVFLWPKNN